MTILSFRRVGVFAVLGALCACGRQDAERSSAERAPVSRPSTPVMTTARGVEQLGRARAAGLAIPAAELDSVVEAGALLDVQPAFGRGEPVGYSAKLPRTANAALTIDTARLGVDVKPLGFAPSAVEFAEHVAMYPAVRHGVHAFRVVRARGIEDFYQVDDPRESFSPAYVVSLRGVAGLRLVDHQLELLDASGAPRLRMPRPSLHDSRGTARLGELAVEGCAYDASPTLPWGRKPIAPGASECTVTVRFDTRGLAFPVLIDPAWETTTANTSQSHAYHRLVRLTGTGEVGKIMLVGGTGSVPGLTEAFDPATKTWATSGSFPDSVTFGVGANAVALADGTVVVSGGFPVSGGSNAQPNVEFRKPGGAWQHGAVMATGRAWHAMVAVTVGGKSQAMIMGGQPNTSLYTAAPYKNVELFDPDAGSSGTWTATGSLSRSRTKHRAVVLADGKVLVAGGEDYTTTTTYLETTEIFDPTVTVGSPWTAGPNMASKRTQLELVALPAGGAIAAGGSSTGSATYAQDTIEHYDGTKWTTLSAKMSAPRWQFSSAVLPDGRVLFSGGQSYATSSFISDTADLLIPGSSPATTATVAGAGAMRIARQFHASAALPDMGILVTGGLTTASSGTETAYTDFFNTAIGGACTVGGTACPSGLSCVDGVCCASSGCPEGQTCNAPGREGVCTKPKGTTCTSNAECGTGYCVTGVCCESACTGGCKACNEVGKEGTCVLAAAGTDPGGFCTGSSDPTCGKKCDGTGKCGAYATEGTACGASVADAGTGSFCTTYACSAYGSCTSKQNNCGLTCTTTVTCNESTKTCSATASGIKAGQCLIDGKCYAYGDINPTDSCLVCDPPTNKLAWSTAASCMEGGVDTGTEEDTSAEDTGATEDTGLIEDTSPVGDDTGPLDGGEDAAGPAELPEASACGCRLPGGSDTSTGALAALGIAVAVLARRRPRA